MVDHLADDIGVILRRDALLDGVDDHELRRLVRAGVLVKLRHGAYALGERWNDGTEPDRLLMLARAVMRRWGERIVLSHDSACLLQGGPSHGLDTQQVHATDLFRRGDRSQARVVHHRGTLLVGDVTRTDDHWITSPTRTALDTASRHPRSIAVALMDDFVHRGLTTMAELEAGSRRREPWPDHASLRRSVSLVRTGSESVGETLLRLALHDLGMPEPVPQFEVRDGRGTFIGRVDLALPTLRILIEFDGMEKYHRFRRPGESIADMVMREKRREDRLRETTGWIVIRITWADLHDLPELARRIRAAARLAA